MDPISAAGIGLSVVSLAFHVFSGCKEAIGYEMFADMVGMPAKYQHFRLQLRIEQSRLMIWGEKIGLVEELLEAPSRALSNNRNLILDVLLEIQACFRSVVKVTADYDALVPQKQILSGSHVEPQSQISILRRSLQRPKNGMARLQWAVIKQERFESLIEKLTGYNNSMESFLDQSMLDKLRAQQEQSNLLLLQVTDQIGQLQILVDALQLAPTRVAYKMANSSLSENSTIVASGNVSVRTFDLARFKLQQKSLKSSSEDTQDLLLHSASIFPQGCPISERRSYTKAYGRDLWVEWTEPVPSVPGIPDLAQILEARVGDLAATLNSPTKPSLFRSPRCLGYLRDEAHDQGLRFGMVYDASFPSNTETQTVVMSLYEIMRTKAKPSLNLRVSLACKIAESLMYLHTVNWLHKGLQSDSILFIMPKSRSWQSTDLEEPIISGFEFSRPDFAKEVTVKWSLPVEQQIYRHPQLLRSSTTRSQKSHDIYGLGLLLLEIAFWKRIEDIADIPMKASSALTLRDVLLQRPFQNHQDLKEAVAAEVGDDFAEASYRCIYGGELLGIPEHADQTDTTVEGEILQSYSQEVLSRLRLSHL